MRCSCWRVRAHQHALCAVIYPWQLRKSTWTMRYAGLRSDRGDKTRANCADPIRRELELPTLAARADNTLVDAFGLLWSQPFPRFSITAPAPRVPLNSKFPRGASCNLFLPRIL